MMDDDDIQPLALYTFGYGKNGQTGHGGRESSFTPQKVEFFMGKWPVEIACGDWHTALLTAASEVYMWGSGRNGQLGNNSWVGSLIPIRIESLAAVNVTQVVCGAIHTMVLTGDGNIYSWGCGKEGQLGHGDKVSLRVPQCIEPFCDDQLTSISAGQAYSAALTEAGQVYTWGSNTEGQLGRREAPLEVPRVVRGFLEGNVAPGDELWWGAHGSSQRWWSSVHLGLQCAGTIGAQHTSRFDLRAS